MTQANTSFSVGRQAWFEGGNPPVLDGDIDAGAAIGQVGIGDQQIKHGGLSLQRSPLMNGFIKARG